MGCCRDLLILHVVVALVLSHSVLDVCVCVNGYTHIYTRMDFAEVRNGGAYGHLP